MIVPIFLPEDITLCDHKWIAIDKTGEVFLYKEASGLPNLDKDGIWKLKKSFSCYPGFIEISTVLINFVPCIRTLYDSTNIL